MSNTESIDQLGAGIKAYLSGIQSSTDIDGMRRRVGNAISMIDDLCSAIAAKPIAKSDDMHDLLIELAREAGFSDAQWKAMFFDKGPYDITYPSFPMKRFAQLLLDRCTPIAAQAADVASDANKLVRIQDQMIAQYERALEFPPESNARAEAMVKIKAFRAQLEALRDRSVPKPKSADGTKLANDWDDLDSYGPS